MGGVIVLLSAAVGVVYLEFRMMPGMMPLVFSLVKQHFASRLARLGRGCWPCGAEHLSRGR